MVLFANAQNVNYKITKDDPSKRANFIMNLDLMQLDMSKNLSGGSFNVGVWGMYNVMPNLYADYKFEKSWLSFAKLDAGAPGVVGNLDFESGATFNLLSSSKNKNMKVVLNVDESYSGSYKTTTTTFLMVPGTIKKVTSVRGGYIFKRNTYEWEKTFSNGYEPMTRMGLYSGISFDRYTNLHINADGYGHCMNSVGSRFYLDLLLMPVNTSPLAKVANNNPLGFRAGWQVFQSYPKADTGKNFGLSSDIQMGLRPYTGFYFTASVGVTIIKK